MRHYTKTFAVVGLATSMLAAGTAARATTFFSDNFNSENGGVGFLNYGTPNQNGFGQTGAIDTSFANWTVSAGSVDLIPIPVNPGPFPGPYNLLPSSYGEYIDLDGTTGQNGTLTSKGISLGAGTYQLFFDMAGSQRGEDETSLISVETGVASTVLDLAANSPMTTYELDFTLPSPEVINLSFADTTSPGNDDVGPLLDNIVLDGVTSGGVPDGGSTMMFLGLATAGLAAVRRSLRR